MAAHVTCPCNTEDHQNYLYIFQNFCGTHTKIWSCLQHTKCQKILIIIYYLSSTQNTNHLKLVTVLITFNFIDLFLKTSQLSFTKDP